MAVSPSALPHSDTAPEDVLRPSTRVERVLADVGGTGADYLTGGAKRALDVVLSVCLLTVFAPVLLAIAVAVRLTSPGPVLFRQKRMGQDLVPFEILKFRSMHVSAQPSVKQATRNDSRVTRIGAILRKTSVDELPQLINVLKGDMSLVGPRPHPVELDPVFERDHPVYMRRYVARPGITGLAQVSGARGETPTPHKRRRRSRLDQVYVDKASLAVDLRILLATARELFDTRHVY